MTPHPIFDFLAQLQPLEISEHNCSFQAACFNRVQALCELKGTTVQDLTLREIQSCIAAGALDCNDRVPLMQPGFTSLPAAAVLARYPAGVFA